MEEENKKTENPVTPTENTAPKSSGRKLFQKGNKEYLKKKIFQDDPGIPKPVPAIPKEETPVASETVTPVNETSATEAPATETPVTETTAPETLTEPKAETGLTEAPQEQTPETMTPTAENTVSEPVTAPTVTPAPQASSGRKLFQKGNTEYLKKKSRSEVREQIVESLRAATQKVVGVSRKKLESALSGNDSAFLDKAKEVLNSRPNLFQFGNEEYARKGRKQRGQENRVDTHARRGKEIIIDTRARDRARKKREEAIRLLEEQAEAERKRRETEERRRAFAEYAKKKAAKNNTDALRLQIKGKEMKVESNGEKEARERIQRAMRTPFTYYYNAALDEKGHITYINVNQIMNDKFAGRIFQPQYFAIAEMSDRIYDVNKLMIVQAVGQSLLKEDTKFVVIVSPRWLEKSEKADELTEMLKSAKDNLIIAMNAETLAMVGGPGIERLENILINTKVSLMLDNVENETFHMILDYPVTYVRLDKRYYVTNRDKKEEYLKVMVEFCKRKKISLSAKYVDDEGYRTWFVKNGINVCEGSRVQPQKFSITSYFEESDKTPAPKQF